jgi:hypothetical protein
LLPPLRLLVLFLHSPTILWRKSMDVLIILPFRFLIG